MDGQWSDVPSEAMEKWREVFDACEGGPSVPGRCPVCGKKALFRYFASYDARRFLLHGREYRGRGGGWEWCRACKSYQHFSACVPAWWKAPVEIPIGSLHHCPETIDEVLANMS